MSLNPSQIQRDAFAVFHRRDERARQRLIAASDAKPDDVRQAPQERNR